MTPRTLQRFPSSMLGETVQFNLFDFLLVSLGQPERAQRRVEIKHRQLF